MPSNPDIFDVMSMMSQGALENVYTTLPAKIISYDHATQKAVIQPLIKRRDRDGDNSADGLVDMALISGVLVVQPSTPEGIVSFPIKAGWNVWLHFCSRSIDNYMFGDGKAPIDVIKEIVNELGGVLQPYPDGSIHAVRRYRVDSDKYSPALAVKTYSTGLDFISLEEDTEKRDGYNKFSVTNVSVSKSWNFESERINDSSYKLKAYKVPWTSDIPVVTTSELTNVTISNIMGPVSEELEEEIEIVSGAGSVDKPCYFVNLVDYKTSTNLGVVTISKVCHYYTSKICADSCLIDPITTPFTTNIASPILKLVVVVNKRSLPNTSLTFISDLDTLLTTVYVFFILHALMLCLKL